MSGSANNNSNNKRVSGDPRSYNVRAVALAALACGALSAGSYLVGIRPAVARVAERDAARQEATDRQAEARRVAGELAAARRRLADARDELAVLPLRLEPASAVNRRLNELARVAAAAGVTLDGVQPQPPIDGPHYQTVPIRVAGTGTYPACAAFLHTVRARFPDTSVRSFELQNTRPARDGNTAAFEVELAWHTVAAGK